MNSLIWQVPACVFAFLATYRFIMAPKWIRDREREIWEQKINERQDNAGITNVMPQLIFEIEEEYAGQLLGTPRRELKLSHNGSGSINDVNVVVAGIAKIADKDNWMLSTPKGQCLKRTNDGCQRFGLHQGNSELITVYETPPINSSRSSIDMTIGNQVVRTDEYIIVLHASGDNASPATEVYVIANNESSGMTLKTLNKPLKDVLGEDHSLTLEFSDKIKDYRTKLSELSEARPGHPTALTSITLSSLSTRTLK